jgi:hypothetical protein
MRSSSVPGSCASPGSSNSSGRTGSIPRCGGGTFVPDALVALFVHEGPPPSVRVPVRQQVSLVKLQEHLFTDAARRELGSRLAEAARESHSMDGGVAAYAETYRRALARRRRWAERAVERSEPYCVLQCRGDARAPDRTLHATGDGRPTRKCMSLSYFGTDGGFFGASSCLQSVEPEQGVPNATSAAQFAKSPGAGTRVQQGSTRGGPPLRMPADHETCSAAFRASSGFH